MFNTRLNLTDQGDWRGWIVLEDRSGQTAVVRSRTADDASEVWLVGDPYDKVLHLTGVTEAEAVEEGKVQLAAVLLEGDAR